MPHTELYSSFIPLLRTHNSLAQPKKRTRGSKGSDNLASGSRLSDVCRCGNTEVTPQVIDETPYHHRQLMSGAWPRTPDLRASRNRYNRLAQQGQMGAS